MARAAAILAFAAAGAALDAPATRRRAIAAAAAALDAPATRRRAIAASIASLAAPATRRRAIAASLASVAAPAVAVTAPDSARVGRGTRAVGTPNSQLDIDAALGISWGGAQRARPARIRDVVLLACS